MLLLLQKGGVRTQPLPKCSLSLVVALILRDQPPEVYE